MSYQRSFDRRIKAAVIGTGSHCYRNILPTMTFLPVELAAVCDVNQEAAQKTAGQYGCAWYTDAEAMYQAHPELEAVFISVSAGLHPQLIQTALKNHKHVWVEKPIAKRAGQVEQLLLCAGDRIVVAGLKKAFTPAAAKAREIISLPQYGLPNSILAVYYMNMPDNGKAALADGSMPNWLRNGVHPLSFMIGTGGSVHSVETVINQAGFGAVLLKFENGVIGNLHLASGPQPDVERYSLFGNKWHLDIEDAKISLRRGIVDFRYAETASYTSPGETGGTVVWDTNSCVATLENKAEFVQGMYQEMKYFCDCVLENRQPELGSLRMAWEVMKVYEAALLSEGREIMID